MARLVSRPDQVEQGEGAHGEAAAALHGRVDPVAVGHVLLEQAHGVVEVGKEQGVHDESGLVLHLDRDFPHVSAKPRAGGDGVVRGGEGP